VGDDFQVEVAKSVSGERPVNTILSQSPSTGKAARGSTISVSIVGTRVSVVPDVVGSGRQEAEQALEAEGFQVEVAERESSFDDQNRVMGQNPSGGARAEVGSGVSITVGTGPSSVPVPRLYGRTPAQADSVLQGAGLSLGTVTRDYNNDVAQGSIFFQAPSRGENVEPGTAVNAIVSLGPEQVEVPEVYGLSVSAAQTALSNVGLNSTTFEVEGDEPAGTALSTEPGVGAMLDPGSTVTLYYSAGPPPATTAPSDASQSPNSEPSQGPDRGSQDAGNTGPSPADGPQRNNSNQDNSGPGSGGQDNSGSGSGGQDNSGSGSGGQDTTGPGSGGG
jgi:beta-lactam-binding protein with PASTA domain